MLLAACSIQLGGSGQNADPIVGSGKPATESRQVSDFSSISVTGNGMLYVELGETPSLTITADDNILPRLTSRVKNGKLIITPEDKTPLQSKVNIEFRVTLQELTGLEAFGNIGINASGVDADNLTVHLNGNSNATLYGQAARQDVTVNGNSFYYGQDLSGQEAEIKLDGNSLGVVNVSDTLDADVSGNSVLEFMGTPKVTRKTDGNGEIRPR
jgi:hypothetical protein